MAKIQINSGALKNKLLISDAVFPTLGKQLIGM